MRVLFVEAPEDIRFAIDQYPPLRILELATQYETKT